MYIDNSGHMTKMVVIPKYGKNPTKKKLLQNRWINFNKTWHEALMAIVLLCMYTS